MGLTLVGMGLWDEQDISLRGLLELEHCDVAYAEEYTNEKREGSLKRLEALCSKSIIILSREEVEDGRQLIAEAARSSVCLVVAGDPMIATTHVSLKSAAHAKGVLFKVIHSSSILSAAISESGLHTYKFGRPVTLPFWSENYKPTSTYDVLLENRKLGMHTLLFLDLKEGKGMTAKEAFSLLEKLEKERGKTLITGKLKLLVLSRVGAPEQKITYGAFSTLKKARLGEPPLIIIVPGKLHFTEEEALATYGPE